MKPFQSVPIQVVDDKILILDQRMLPQKETWLTCHTIEDMIQAIRQLSVRGAPAIGVAAALSLAQLAEKETDLEKIKKPAFLLAQARPTAINLAHALHLLMREIHQPSDIPSIVERADKLVELERDMSEKMACLGAELIEDGEGLLTHCNTGALVTTGSGTALAVIARAHQMGKKIHVFVDETRPLLQGARLTTWELERLQIPYTLICDHMAAVLMRKGKIQRVFVGADRIAINGDSANKIGTYNAAVQAHHHKVPFHFVAPSTTLDFQCPTGKEIPIEERDASEVRGISGAFGNLTWSPTESAVFNPAFDVTPIELITSIVLDSGVYSRLAIQSGAFSNKNFYALANHI